MKTLAIVILFFALNAKAQLFFDSQVETRIDTVVSLFENTSMHIRYDYIAQLPEGRGYTAGKVGFTTGTGDLLQVVETYLEEKPNVDLTKLLPVLKKRAADESEDISGLEALPDLWKKLAEDPDFIKAQDKIANKLYHAPALTYMATFHFHSALTLLIFYDTLVQHGEGADPDSFGALLDKVDVPDTSDEPAFLAAFLKMREQDLLHAHNKKTRKEWRESVDRVHALQKLLAEKKMDLKGDITVHVWDEDFKLP